MLLLAVESATEAAGVALADEEGVLGSFTVARGRRHAETMAPAIEALCRRVGVGLGELEMIGVDVGPGLFTGLRVGVATAKALAFGLEIPVVTAGSLEVLAHAAAGAATAAGRLVVPVVDARRAEVFSSRFADRGGSLTEVTGEAVWAPEALARSLADEGQPVVLIGNGALRYRSLFSGLPGAALAGPAYSSPPVTALARLCVERARAGGGGDGAAVMPRYLRQADARINWEQRIPARPAGAGR